MRLGNIDNLNLNLFNFDYDLTYSVFFFDADENVYGRYGQRNADSADSLQSLKGLHAAMQSVLAMHARNGGEQKKVYAPREKESITIREIAGGGRRCFHCHNVKEAFNRGIRQAGKWDRSKAFRYPLPDNLGFTLGVDAGKVVEKVRPGTPADRLGLKKGDVIEEIGAVPVHSIADAQYGLDRAPGTGELALKWLRDGKPQSGKIALPEGWRTSDLSWRASMRRMVASLPLRGTDLTEKEKSALGLPRQALAFRQRSPVNEGAAKAGVKAGDVIVGIDGGDLKAKDLEGLRDQVGRFYLLGDTIQVNVLRDGKRVNLPLTLR